MPDIMPPGQDQASADAEALQRASDQLGEASEAVAEARTGIEKAASKGDAASDETRAAQASLEAAEEALADASEQLARAAEQGGGDSEELNEAVAAAEEALAAAEEALAAAEEAAAEAAAAEPGAELAEASGGGEEEPLPAAEENPSGGGGASAAAAQSSAAAARASAAGGAAGGAQDLPASEESGSGGQPGLVVAIAGANGSLDQAQDAVAGAIRALVITGVYQPPGGQPDIENGQGLPAGGVIVLMPGEPDENEKVAQLESELEDTLVVIDGRLLDERNRLANQRTGGSAVVPGDEGISDDPGAEAAALLAELGDGGEDELAGGDDEMTEETAGGEIAGADMQDLGEGKRSDNTIRPGNIPEGIPDGSDDDIVARQIREAAMNETDPVLREKLWREYVNYKKGGN